MSLAQTNSFKFSTGLDISYFGNTDLRDSAGMVPDPGNKVRITIK